MRVLIISCNTPRLTECAIRSLNRHTPGCRVFVFDNSDTRPFLNSFPNVTVIDNTRSQIINWERWLRTFPAKYPHVNNNYGSARHTKTIDLCFDIIPDGFILLESDTLIHRDITPLWNDYALATGTVITDNHPVAIPRLAPYLCHINVPLCRSHAVSYFNPEYTWKLVNYSPNRFYDTGAWFYRQIREKHLQLNRVNYSDYILHLRGGSWKNKQEAADRWLSQNRHLWQ